MMSSLSDMFSQLHSATLSDDRRAPDDLISLNSFYKSFASCRFEQERTVFVSNHVKYLKWQITSTVLTELQTSIILERCTICKTMNQDVSFATIYAIQLAQSAQLWHHKLSAYNFCCQLLNEKSEMSMLMVSTLQRDLRSRHVPSIRLSLTTAASILSAEMIPSVYPIICDRIKHADNIVRKNAVMCLGVFIHRDPNSIEATLPYLKVCVPEILRGRRFVVIISSLSYILLCHNNSWVLDDNKNKVDRTKRRQA